MAAKKYFVDIDLNRNALANAVLENTTAANVVDPKKGQIIFDTESKTLKYWDGGVWQSSETRLSGALQYKGGIASNAAEPNLPQAGDLYVFNSYGRAVNFEKAGQELYVEIGDFAIRNSANGWDIIQGNVSDATVAKPGMVQLATESEAINATNSTKVITPSSLGKWANQANNTVVRKKIYNDQTIAIAGTELSHDFDSPQVKVYDQTGDEVDVMVVHSANKVTLSVNRKNLEKAKVVISS